MPVSINASFMKIARNCKSRPGKSSPSLPAACPWNGQSNDQLVAQSWSNTATVRQRSRQHHSCSEISPGSSASRTCWPVAVPACVCAHVSVRACASECVCTSLDVSSGAWHGLVCHDLPVCHHVMSVGDASICILVMAYQLWHTSYGILVMAY